MREEFSKVITYNPHYCEEHLDTTDFEDYSSPLTTNKNINFRSLMVPRIFKRKTPMQEDNQQITKRNQLYSDMEDKADQELQYLCWKTLHSKNFRPSKDVDIETNSTDSSVSFPRDDQNYVNVTQRKRFRKKKMMTSFSNIFGRPKSNFQQLSTINECDSARIDNCCQVYCAHCYNDSFRMNTQMQGYPCQQYVGPYMYDVPVKDSPQYNEPISYPNCLVNDLGMCKNQYPNIDAESENEIKIILPTKKYFKNKRAKKMKTPKVDGKKCEQVYFSAQENASNTVYVNHPDEASPKGSPYYHEAACPRCTTSALFWEFIHEKLNKRFTSKMEPCQRTYPKQISLQEVELINHNNLYSSRQLNTFPNPCYVNCSCQTLTPTDLLCPVFVETASGTPNNITQSTAEEITNDAGKDTIPQPKTDSNFKAETQKQRKSCQGPHDKVKTYMEKKYKGDILCIHNPQCILINGCLNLPLPQENTRMHLFNGSEDTCQSKFEDTGGNPELSLERKPIDLNMQKPLMEECQTENMSPRCHPCKPSSEAPRNFYKYKGFEPTANTCAHASMREKLPHCKNDKKSKFSWHKSKCSNVREYAEVNEALKEVETVETILKHKPKPVCQHTPPCIIIPKCLGRKICEGLVSYDDALPECTHKPTCEKIPGCCRRSPKMISVYSQYPAPCRIV